MRKEMENDVKLINTWKGWLAGLKATLAGGKNTESTFR